jgi:HEAT repeat protein
LNPLLSIYALVLGGVFLLWLGVALYVVLTRAIYDVRRRASELVGQLLERRARGALRASTPAELEAAIERLSKRALFRLAAEAATPETTARVLAERALERDHARIVAAAATHGTELEKWQRISALRVLMRARFDDAWPLADAALADPDEDVVAAAVATLGATEHPRAAVLLVQALHDGVLARSRVASQLDGFGAELAPLLVPFLADPDGEVRFWGVTLLGRSLAPHDPAWAEIALLARDEEPSVRAAAVEALAQSQAAPAQTIAVALLDDPVWYVRAHAARALQRVGDAATAADVAALLTDGSWWARSAAKETLAESGPAAAEAVFPLLDSSDEFARNGAAEVLQNMGYLDLLVTKLVVDPRNDLIRRRLLKIFEAGGREIAEACARRADPRAALRVRELMRAAGHDAA